MPTALQPHLVNVYIAGVQKGGSTALYAYFKKHPLLARARGGKEIHFFDDEEMDWSVGADYDSLHRLYPAPAPELLRYDATPSYFHWPPSLARICAYNRDAKFILLFRDPIERAFSQWRMYFGRKVETLPFDQAIRSGRDRVMASPPLSRARRVFAHVERGFYARQLRRALDFFPREQLLCLRSQDLLSDDRAVLGSISGFLNIDRFPKIPQLRRHVGTSENVPPKPTEEDVQMLAELYYDDVLEFAEMTGLRVDDWLTIRTRRGST